MLCIDERLALLSKRGDPGLCRTRIGLEKESLRTTLQGALAQTSHPAAWGAALTHPYVTTDYAESLTELITPPLTTIPAVLDYLTTLHTYAYQHLPQEMLWAASMPCRLPVPEQIPVADYGVSNLGRMKQLYRIGLGHRYGRAMQVIAGVHFNWSMPEAFWPEYQAALNLPGTPNALRDTHYMGLVRNIIRYGWLIPYLFGASPAIDRSFVQAQPTRLAPWDADTYYQPHATSLRMGDIGYQNSIETELAFRVDYNQVTDYAKSLLQATQTAAEPWQRLGVKVGDAYRQLNANILQIENEYYSTVRPKQLVQGLESPAIALATRGINHIELRSLDVNPYEPLGVSQQQLYFLDAFMLTYLLAESPPLDATEQQHSQHNLLTIAHQGRANDLLLRQAGHEVSRCTWGLAVLQTMEPVCHWLDQQNKTQAYSLALQAQQHKMREPTLTPSALIMHDLHDKQISYAALIAHYSMAHRDAGRQRTLTAEQQQQFQQMSVESQQRLAAIEADTTTDFATFLANYFASVAQATEALGAP